MKNKDKLMLVVSVLFLLFVVLIFINAVQVGEIEVPNQDQVSEEIQTRRSVTFILGEDKTSANAFYTNAESYFLLNPEAQTDDVIKHARSLNEVYNSLNEDFTRKAQSYSDIHVVVHSNPWAGISIPVEKDGERITNESLLLSIDQDEISKLNPLAVDSQTTVHIHACGLGNNVDLVETLRSTLNGSKMVTSDGYVNFAEENGFFKKSEMEVFYAFYPTAFKPADLHLARQLKGRYPSENIEWLSSMKNSSYQYNIPIEWEIKYPEYEVPELADESDKMEWLMNQDDLLDIIDKTGIPFDYFRWNVKKKKDSIVVYGKVTVMCVMREMEEV